MKFIRTVFPIAILALSLAFSGCAATQDDAEVDTGTTAAEAEAATIHPGGALLWEQNCGRCHNYRRPRERDDGEWRIIVHHMRVRANLTATEHDEILRFLQAAN